MQPWMRRIYRLLPKLEPPSRFSGWGMTTEHELPWLDGWTDFLQAADGLRRFERSNVPSSLVDTDSLLWRHWLVAYAVHHAAIHVAPPSFIGVECGTADGYTAHIALSQMRADATEYEMHLYDAWADITDGPYAGEYGDLSQERTRRNLMGHAGQITWHRGYIPSTLDEAAPEVVHWLHVDLNSAATTRAALEFFWPRIPAGGLALFDDYGWRGFEDTRRTIYNFLRGKAGTLLPLPTGQAIYFR